MVQKGVLFILFAVLLMGVSGSAGAEEAGITLRVIGPSVASPFRPQLLVQVINESFTSLSLVEKVNLSELMVDGRSFKRIDSPFTGPAGIAPKGSWEGCLSIEDYVPGGLKEGRHRVELLVGQARSAEIHFRMPRVSPVAVARKERARQVNALADILVPGLLQSCVENWLTEKDGGLQTLDQTHYYIEPDIKVLISYELARPEPRVKGRARIYPESRIAD